jgi:hypothetical protein
MNRVEKHVLKAKETAPMLGMVVTDSISGITGVIRGVRIFFTGCENILLQRKGVDPMGNAYDPRWTEMATLKKYETLPLTKRPDILGKEVKDTITDYTGIAVSIIILDNYDARVYIQGKTRTQDGVPSPEHICELTFVERVDKKPTPKTNGTGAPAFLERARASSLKR